MVARPLTVSPRYSMVAIVLHWTMAALILGQIVGGVVMHKLAYSDFKVALYQWHKSFGLLVLVLALLRLAWRLSHRPPPEPEGLPAWQSFAAKSAHVGLYVLMIGAPLLGWLYISASTRGVATEFFGLFPVPDLPVTQGKASADLLKTLHKVSAVSMLVLIGVHAGAALHHHFVKRDDVLLRMVPGLKVRS